MNQYPDHHGAVSVLIVSVILSRVTPHSVWDCACVLYCTTHKTGGRQPTRTELEA